MYILRVFTGDETLTYTFQNTSWGKSGDDGIGITVFISAFKKYYANHSLRATLSIMNDIGLFYNPTTNRYVMPEKDGWKEVTIPLNDKELT